MPSIPPLTPPASPPPITFQPPPETDLLMSILEEMQKQTALLQSIERKVECLLPG